jgi:hypothetical protein
MGTTSQIDAAKADARKFANEVVRRLEEISGKQPKKARVA